MKYRITMNLVNARGHDAECLVLPGIVWSRHKDEADVAGALHFGWLFWGVGLQWARLLPDAGHEGPA